MDASNVTPIGTTPTEPKPHPDSPEVKRALNPEKLSADAARKRRSRLLKKLQTAGTDEEAKAILARAGVADPAAATGEKPTDAKPAKAKRPNPTPEQVREVQPIAAMIVGAYAAQVERSPVLRVDEVSAKAFTESIAGLLAKYLPKDLEGPEGAFLAAVAIYALPRAAQSFGLAPAPAAEAKEGAASVQ